MGFVLREGISFCEVSDRLLFLDLVADRYFCLRPRTEHAFRSLLLDQCLDEEQRGDLAGMLNAGSLIETPGREVPHAFRFQPQASLSLLDRQRPRAKTSRVAGALAAIMSARLNLRWRRLHHLLRAVDIRLDRLHSTFQAALAWTDSHLWELTFGHTGFGIPDPSYGFDGPLDARKTTLAQALEGMRGKTFRYLYDFGDAWEHSVKIQGIAPADPNVSYPRLLDATGMRPPEDSGGPWGYAEKLEALADPTHEYHEEALDALGNDHDPHAPSNIGMINDSFAALAKKWASRPQNAK